MSFNGETSRPGFRGFGDVLLAIAILVILDVGLFHQRGYVPWLKPDSYSGRVEATSRRFQGALEAHPELQHLVVLGDSTGGASVQEELLENQLHALGRRLRVTNMAQGGSTSRSWYHLMANERVSAPTTRALALGVHPGALVVFQTLKPDLDIVKSRVRVSDARTLALGYSALEMKARLLFGSFFRLPWFREDLRDFLESPRRRLDSVALARTQEVARGTTWRRTNRSSVTLLSARLGPGGHLVETDLDPAIRRNSALRAQLERGLRRQNDPPSVRLRMDPRKRLLLERLIRLMDDRGVRTILFTTPHGPFPFANRDIADLQDLVSEMQEAGHAVTFLEMPELLASLESPKYFRDSLHLNAEGADLFTRALAKSLAPHLEL